MLTLAVDLDQLDSAWRQERGGLRGPAGHLTPLQHPMVSAKIDLTGDGWQIFVHENHDGAESLLIEGDASSIRINAGSGGVCPLYLVMDGSMLRGSWNPTDLLQSVSPDQLVDRAVARLLTRRQRYSADTIYDGLHRLTERSVTIIDGSGISVRYPESAEHVLRARELRRRSDPVEAFNRLLTARLAELSRTTDLRRALEISGGLDSAVVATAFTHAGADGVASVGLAIDGSIGEQQASRREAIIHRLHLRDYTVPARAHLPFEPSGPRSTDRLHYADGDVYAEAFDHLRGWLRDAGTQVLLTGFGGDELMALRGSEQPGMHVTPPPELPCWLGERALRAVADLEANTAPASPVAIPTLMVFAARNPAYIAHGLWPVAPLADSALLRLCESLPVAWRSRKTLLRHYLRRAGFGSHVTDPRTVESFQSTMELAIRRHGTTILEQMLDDSILVDQGFLDRRCLQLIHTALARDGVVPPLLYDTIAVERSLQSHRHVTGRDG
ncbi:hypothetical protein AB0P21_33955 [Kribbella sp. NPDC056861]|uniref:hypothetical protein n=1 Tax=Kribbella sp. NPDC056861 TaxID=3154857 RepID=UPI003430DAC5